jgi:hypothetical protein
MNYLGSGTKTSLKVQCECRVKFLLFKGAHNSFSMFGGCVSHIIAPKPLHSAPELQEARM